MTTFSNANTEKEIINLQNNLQTIRRAGGWSAEEFGDMIGVTKQTISNLENKRTPMSKTQYIAIRAVLDYEMNERSEDDLLISTVNICLNSEGLDEEEIKKAQAFISGATKTGLDKAAIRSGLITLLGAAAIGMKFSLTAPHIGKWLAGIIGSRKK